MQDFLTENKNENGLVSYEATLRPVCVSFQVLSFVISLALHHLCSLVVDYHIFDFFLNWLTNNVSRKCGARLVSALDFFRRN